MSYTLVELQTAGPNMVAIFRDTGGFEARAIYGYGIYRDFEAKTAPNYLRPLTRDDYTKSQLHYYRNHADITLPVAMFEDAELWKACQAVGSELVTLDIETGEWVIDE